MIAGHFEVTRIINDLRAMDPHDDVAIDTETTGTRLYTGDAIRGISLAYALYGGKPVSWYVPISHPDSDNVTARDAGRLGLALRDTAALPVFHNGPGFDWRSLSEVGYMPPDRFWDTQIVSWLQDENTTHALKGLGALIWGEDEKEEQLALKALFKGQKKSDLYKLLRAEGWPVGAARLEASEKAAASKKDWGSLTAKDIAQYAEKDAVLTLRLKWWQVEQLAKESVTNPSAAVQREFDFAALIYRIVERGVAVDTATAVTSRAANLARIAEIEPTFEGTNLNSSKQLAKLIYEDWGLPVGLRTATGAPSTSRDALEELEGAHESLDLLLEYRKLAKAVSTYYDMILANTDDRGRVHPGFCTTCTVYGRLSSRGPNLMNLPREETDAEVKKVFRPAPARELWEFDLKSAELFVGASQAQDDDMLAALSEPGRDFHTETAMAIFGDIEGNHRTLAKNMNYGIPYYIGPRTFALYVVKGTGHGVRSCSWCREDTYPPRPIKNCDVCYSRTLIQKHRLTWPKTHLAMNRLLSFARSNGYIPLHKPGRFRHFRSPGKTVPYYTAFNAVVQGGVAELMKDVMLDIEQPAAQLGAEMVLQVHDSLWFELIPGTEDALGDLIQEVTDAVNPFTARMTWDAKQLKA